MSYFDNHFYNPNYFNPAYYQQVKNTIDSSLYSLDQDQRVLTAIHDFQNMLDQVEGMDGAHQERLFGLCLAEMAKRRRWG